MNDLTIVVVHYNTPDLVEKCLESLQKFVIKHSAFAIKVVVVDNGSEMPAQEAIANLVPSFSFVELLQLDKNLGFAGGNNIALQKADSRYVMLLNSDTEAVAETHLDRLIKYMDLHPEVAVMTPRLQLSSGGIDWASHRGEPTPWASLTYFSGLERLFPKVPFVSQYHQTYQNLDTIHTVDACSGAAMLVRTSAMHKVGYLDEEFFMYAEDLDWCKRFREAGYQIIYFPDSLIIHHKYKSGIKHHDASRVKKTSHHFYDTMLQYFDKHYQGKYPRWMRWVLQLFIRLKKGVL